METVSIAALDALAGEVLPERAVLGIVSTPFNNAGGGGDAGSGSSSSSAAAAGGAGGAGGNTIVPDDDGTVMSSACQTHTAEGTPGLLGGLGLGSNNPSEAMTCVPSTVATP